MKRIIGLILLIVVFVLNGEEVKVRQIMLEGPVTDGKAEISGMAWYQEHLILLPQYPHKFRGNKNAPWVIFAVPKKDILSYLSHPSHSPHSSPIRPKEIELVVPDSLLKGIHGFQGFEALGFWGDRVFLTIEAHIGGDRMMGWVVRGNVLWDKKRIVLDTNVLPAKVQPAAVIDNFTEESILVTKDRVITIYEANGENVNKVPKAHVFDHDLKLIKKIPFPNIEYRITDATELDERGVFWAINYLWPDDRTKLKVGNDAYIKKYGLGASHQEHKGVERLVALKYSGDAIARVNRAPVQLELGTFGKGESCNWEGIVRLDDRGFLIVTDKFPGKTTILGFVANMPH